MKQLSKALLTVIYALLIYYNEKDYLLISLFFLITASTFIKNPYAYITIIPLINLNLNYFFILLFFSVTLLVINILIKSNIKLLAIQALSLIFYVVFLFYLKLDWKIICFLIIWQAIIITTFLLLKKHPSAPLELLTLTIFCINFAAINKWIVIGLAGMIFLTIRYLYNKNYLLYTSFLMMGYMLFKTSDLTYLLIYILAYLSHLSILKKSNDSLELVIDDISTNITNFCSFMSEFANDNFDYEWEGRLSIAIKILIEGNCKSCKNRNSCYSNLKFKTYKYLKDLLLKNNEAGYFTCLYYQEMVGKAKDLHVKYQLSNQPDKDQIQFNNLALSLSQYFVGLFEKTTPKTLELLNFKNQLSHFKISHYQNQIFDENHYSIRFKFHEKLYTEIVSLINTFLPNHLITKHDQELFISPQQKYHIVYDSATLSHNNYQLSGDNYLFKNLTEGFFICALADGMGSGYEAYKLSSETLKMINRITKCTLDYETSLSILNNFFKMRDLDGAYSTLDFVNIDLITGNMHLYKLGSSTTFIVRDEKIIQIYNNNLPFGINDLVVKEEYSLKNNDLIILISDGVTDYISEAKLENYIYKLRNETPHRIVYEILQGICFENNQKINDDMTCIVLKVTEKASLC